MESRITKLETAVGEMETTLSAIRSGQLVNRGLLIVSILVSLLLSILRLMRTEPAVFPTAPTSIENNTNVGAVKNAAADRDWITVEEFATRNNMATRTVLAYIADGRISPPPTKTARAWQLAADSRIQPLSAAVSGSQP